MPVNLNRDDENSPIWTPHPEYAKGYWQDADADEWYRLRSLYPAIMDHFERQAGRVKQLNPVTRQMEMVRNDTRWRELMYDFVIADWRLQDGHGNQWPCTLENKLKLASLYAQRVNWIIETAMAYGNDDAVREEAEKASFRGVDQTAPGSSNPGVLDVRGSDPGEPGALRSVPDAAVGADG